MEDEGAGLIPAKSVFTHLFEEDERSRFFEMASNAGLPVQWMSAGYFPGSDRLTGQDILLLGL